MTTSHSPEELDRVERLEREVADLRAALARFTEAPLPAHPRAGDTRTGAVTRRTLLGALPVAVVADAVLPSGRAAAATPGAPLIIGAENATGGETTQIDGPLHFQAILPYEPGPYESSTTITPGSIEARRVFPERLLTLVTTFGGPTEGSGSLLVGDGGPDSRALLTVRGVGSGQGQNRPAAQFRATGAAAVQAVATTGLGGRFSGPDHETPATGVEVTADRSSTGVQVSVERGRAITATAVSVDAASDAVDVTTAGLGRALLGTVTNERNSRGAVTGVSQGTGAGVWGHQSNPTSTEAAVVGWSDSAAGRGGRFRGRAAQIRLSPGLDETHPDSGLAGDLYVDSTSRLWFCSGGSAWTRLA